MYQGDSADPSSPRLAPASRTGGAQLGHHVRDCDNDTRPDEAETIVLVRFIAFVYVLQFLGHAVSGLVEGDGAKMAVWFLGAGLVFVAGIILPRWLRTARRVDG